MNKYCAKKFLQKCKKKTLKGLIVKMSEIFLQANLPKITQQNQILSHTVQQINPKI